MIVHDAMARALPENRLEQLIDAAAGVFIALGYRRTQMDDIAQALGVAKGTLYASVKSKEALFEAAITFADRLEPMPDPDCLPLATPLPGATLEKIRQRIAQATRGLEIAAALKRTEIVDPAAEFSSIVHDLYARLSQNRKTIKILDRSALDLPGLAEVWFGEARKTQLAALTRYLDLRISARLFRPLRNTEVFARNTLETIVFWAVHRHWDPVPQTVKEEDVGGILVDALFHGLAKERL